MLILLCLLLLLNGLHVQVQAEANHIITEDNFDKLTSNDAWLLEFVRAIYQAHQLTYYQS